MGDRTADHDYAAFPLQYPPPPKLRQDLRAILWVIVDGPKRRSCWIDCTVVWVKLTTSQNFEVKMRRTYVGIHHPTKRRAVWNEITYGYAVQQLRVCIPTRIAVSITNVDDPHRPALVTR